MSFDPSVYDRSDDFQNEPNLPADQWIERFVTHMKKIAEKCAAPDFLAEMEEYARDTAPSYLVDRKEYVTPEEAAETDVSYWESDE
jgi:hypothetical protein